MRVASLGTTIGLGLTLLGGCGSDKADVGVNLKPLEGCNAVQGAIKLMALSEMNRRIDENLKQALQSNYCSGGGEQNSMDSSRGGGVPMSAPSAPSGKSAESSGGASQTSTTNNQVAGVDEADFIKNDNKYLYVVSGQHFRIIEAWPAASTRQIAKVKIEGQPKKLFVARDRALIYASLSSSSSPSYPGSRECTYGYSCRFTGDGKPTQITVWDIADRKAPKLVRKLTLSGSYINARRVGSAVYTVLSSPGVAFPNLRYAPKNLGCGGTMHWWLVNQAYEELRAENTKIIQETQLKDWLPSVEDTILQGASAGKKQELLAGCKGFYRSSISDGGQFTTLLSMDMTRETKASSSTIVSRPGAIYASAKALYMAVPHERHSGRGWFGSMRNASEASTVHKFRLSPSTATAGYAASGVVKGRALNQFAMDEDHGFLRMATSTGRVPATNVHSTLTVLQHSGGTSLEHVGVVDNLAPKEDIRSVRFDGDRGYVVTFKKTDPLFVFDLSRPRQPRVMAELKIPGFSTYMHMMDDKHLLTIGYDANDQGSFAWFTGVLLQIFDVTDPKNPRLAHKEVIGTRGSSSAALNNHLAFNYFAPKKLLALPMTVCDGGSGGGGYGAQMTFSGLMVYDTTAASGFALRGRVDHPAGTGIGCNNWWTNAKSQVERSVIMDDYVFSVSRSLIKVNSLKSLPQDVVVVSIAD